MQHYHKYGWKIFHSTPKKSFVRFCIYTDFLARIEILPWKNHLHRVWKKFQFSSAAETCSLFFGKYQKYNKIKTTYTQLLAMNAKYLNYSSVFCFFSTRAKLKLSHAFIAQIYVAHTMWRGGGGAVDWFNKHTHRPTYTHPDNRGNDHFPQNGGWPTTTVAHSN